MEDMTDADVKEMDFQSYFRMGLVTKGVRRLRQTDCACAEAARRSGS